MLIFAACCVGRRTAPSIVASLAALAAAACTHFAGGCTQPEATPTVTQAAFRQPYRAEPPADAAAAAASDAPSAAPTTGAPSDGAIATVDGRPIGRRQLTDLLLAGHGVGVLEQLVVLERAKQLAAKQGILVTPKDIEAEYERMLRNLLSPLEAADEAADFDRAEAERLLEGVLAKRNISRAEYMQVVERNAYLRALVSVSMKFTDQQVREEYGRLFGARAEIRHIQLASLPEAQKVAALLKAGDDFASAARNHSQNLRTGPAGGLLPAFTRNDESIPRGLRETAFRLKEGEVSPPVRVDDWYHIVRLERMLPAEERPLVEVRPLVESSLRKRQSEPAMQNLYRQLFEQADIKINDPVLAKEFARKHPERVAKSR